MRSLRKKLKRSRPLLGTFVEIEVEGDHSISYLNDLISEGFKEISHVDRLMSVHRSDSDLSRLNRAKPGVWTPVHAQTLAVLRMTNTLYDLSQGFFDVRASGIPAKAAAMAPLEFKGQHARKSGPWSMDLGGIAKGYAVDRAGEKMTALEPSLHYSSVNAGGDLRFWGQSASPVGVRIHRDHRPLVKTMRVGPTAIATSSVRPQESHRLMPSGRPFKRPGTAMVFADRCILADALTKIVLMGPSPIAKTCLDFYRAHALVFAPTGRLERVFT